MGDNTDASAGGSAHLDECAHRYGRRAEACFALAMDHDRWGLSEEAAALRSRARQHRVDALRYAALAAAERTRRSKAGSDSSD